MAEFSTVEFDDLNEIIKKTLNSLIAVADKHNIDRDSFIKYFCAVFSTMAEVSTFVDYKKAASLERSRATVAEEIFAEIEKLKGTKYDWTDCVEWDGIAELKKKYTEERDNG